MTRRFGERYRRVLIGCLVLAGACCQTVSAQPLVSGEPIPVGNAQRQGRLASGISTLMMGVIEASEGKPGGIFTVATHHSSHPGLYFYPLLERGKDGVPVVGPSVEIDQPKGLGHVPLPGIILQNDDGKVHALWLEKDTIRRTTLDQAGRRFIDSTAGPLALQNLPRPASWLGVVPADQGAVDLLIGVEDGTPTRPQDGPDWRDPAYRPFDGAGVYRGGIPFTFMYAVRLDHIDGSLDGMPRLVSPSQQEVLMSYGSLTRVDLGVDRERDVMTGSWFGNLHYYHNANRTGVTLEPYRLVADEAGRAHFHPSVWPSPMAIINPQSGRRSDLLVGGQGAVYYYRFTGRFLDNGSPVYADPIPVLEQDAKLYASSLPVLSAVDWDGNGALDIVAGNSEGRVLWFRNTGSTEAPAFNDSLELTTVDRPIHILPGYGDIQGPLEARWGYTCPTVADWNGDGLPDILISGATARHEVFLNIGTRTAPNLAPARTLYCRGLDLHGTWRVQPGVAKAGNRMAYITLDDQDEFHLYWRIDDYNLQDGGKLRLDDGSTIRANFLSAGGTGRAKIVLTDWDGDGKLDLLVGTPRHGSIPNKEQGLPQSLGLKGAAVVFLRNVGTNEQPTLAFPTLIRFRGEPIYLGQHACGPAVWNAGRDEGPDLIVANQDGRILFYAREDLSWDPIAGSHRR
ncbi:MAG: VCBS repeat-containing protein [Phycisphaeraceae bacterium]|nr:VCBS repeat-containing protein [Phycisphaeraceae bacterium]